MDDQDKILHFLQMTGPTIPGKVAKHIHTEILFASAHLSDLSAQGKVKISHLKIGGSPLYYLSGQEEHLFGFAQNNLNPKDLKVLCLPGPEALEIKEVYDRLGIPRENIFGVEIDKKRFDYLQTQAEGARLFNEDILSYLRKTNERPAH